MSVDEAVPFFAAHPSTHRALRLMQDVGLGYLTLGQQSPTLSGGEAQRLKLVTELAKTSEKKTLYVLDEPSIGLHSRDNQRLIDILLQLRDQTAAEDAVQETLLAALQAGAAYAGRSSVKTWLVGILKHKIIDTHRRQAREQPLVRPDGDDGDAAAEQGHERDRPDQPAGLGARRCWRWRGSSAARRWC